MSFKDIPIQRKLTILTLLISGAVILLTCASFFAYEILTFRQTTIRHISTLGEIIAANSTAALAFDNQDDAKEILTALRAERDIVAACLYNKEGKVFSRYPTDLALSELPVVIENDGYHFERSHLIAFKPVIQNGSQLGVLYIKAGMGATIARFRLYGIVVILVTAASLFLAYVLSRILQREVSQPILALAGTAQAISERRDYSVRALKVACKGLCDYHA